MENFSSIDRAEFKNHRNFGKSRNLLINLIRILPGGGNTNKEKIRHFAAMLRKRRYFAKKVSSRRPGLRCSYEKIFIQIAEISVLENELTRLLI